MKINFCSLQHGEVVLLLSGGQNKNSKPAGQNTFLGLGQD